MPLAEPLAGNFVASVTQRPNWSTFGPWLPGHWYQKSSRLLAHGQKLPSERNLADQWQIGHQTVRRAMRELRERGLIVSVVGKGTFVR